MRYELRLFITTFALAFSAPITAQAQQSFDFYEGIRSLGMGGAVAGVVNDETSLLTNPAGLAKVREFTVSYVNPQIQAGSTATDLFNASNYNSALDAQSLLNALKSTPGKPYDARVSLFPSIVAPNFGFGVLGKAWYDALVSPDGKNFYLNYVNDFAATLGFSLRLFGGIVKIGFGGRLINRSEVAQKIPTTSTGLSFSSLQRNGMGLASDLGLIVSAPIVWLPSLAFVAHDVGGTAYGLPGGVFANTVYKPADTPTRIDGAISLFPIIGKRTRASLTVEMRDLVTLSSETDTFRRFHAGAELNIADFLFLRAGIYQHYWTAGLEFSTPLLQIQAASYGQEVGLSSSNLSEDRRYVGQIGFRF